MTAEEFRAWVDRHGSHRQVATALGISRNSLRKYLDEGPTLTVALACRGLDAS